jgi:hypothetical protein
MLVPPYEQLFAGKSGLMLVVTQSRTHADTFAVGIKRQLHITGNFLCQIAPAAAIYTHI